jgi:palmitoyl-protein thioesterase
MRVFSALLFIPLVATAVIELQLPFLEAKKPPSSLPVVLWHGLGDTYDSKGMSWIAADINDTYPGTFVYSIYLNEDSTKDRNAGFLGHVADQVKSNKTKLM